MKNFFVDVHVEFLGGCKFLQVLERLCSETSQCIAIYWNRTVKSNSSSSSKRIQSFFVGGCYVLFSAFQNGLVSSRPVHALDTSSRTERYTNGTTRPGLSWFKIHDDSMQKPLSHWFWGPRKLTASPWKIPPQSLTYPWKWMVGILIFFWDGLCSGAMLVFGRVMVQRRSFPFEMVSFQGICETSAVYPQ